MGLCVGWWALIISKKGLVRELVEACSDLAAEWSSHIHPVMELWSPMLNESVRDHCKAHML
jgi:hypothetical protein